MPSFDLQFVTEEGDFVRFGFEIRDVGMSEYKIQNRNPLPDVFEFMPPAIAQVLAAKLSVQLSGEEGDRPRRALGAERS